MPGSMGGPWGVVAQPQVGGGGQVGGRNRQGEGRTTGTHTIKYIWYKTIEELLDGSVKEIINLLEFHQLNGLLGPI